MFEIEVAKKGLQLKNETLAKATTDFAKIGATIAKNSLKACCILADVNSSKCYEEDGFADAIEWAEQLFSIKKTTSYSMMRIGEKYVDRKSYKSKLSTAEGDFTVSKLGILLPLGFEDAKQALDTGAISPTMTAKELRKAVKELQECGGDVIETVATGEKDVDDTEPEPLESNDPEPVTTVKHSVDFIIEEVDGHKLYILEVDGKRAIPENVQLAINYWFAGDETGVDALLKAPCTAHA